MADSKKPADADPSDKKEGKPDFLTLQQNDATAAIGRVIANMSQSLKEGADVKEWARQYPWITAGSAAAVGFVVGMLATPSKSSSLKAKYTELKNALTPAPTAEELAGALAEEKRKSDKPGMLSNLLRELTKSVAPMIAAMAGGKMAQPDNQNVPPAPPSNGNEGMPEGFGVYRDSRYASS